MKPIFFTVEEFCCSINAGSTKWINLKTQLVNLRGRCSFVIPTINESLGYWSCLLIHFIFQSVNLKYICGGTLLSQRHVITAAHCVTRKRTMGLVPTKTLTVYLGKFNLRLSVEGVQIRFVSITFISWLARCRNSTITLLLF